MEPERKNKPKYQIKGMAVFGHRDFSLFYFSKTVAAIALQMVRVAIAYQIYDLTGNPMDLAYMGLATFAPAIGFSLFTGYMADLFDRRLVISICYAVMLLSALLFLFFTLSGTAMVWPAFAIMAVMGTGRAFYQPASTSLLPNLVPADIFPNAVAWNTTSIRISQIVGPALGGMLYLAGPEVVYTVSAMVLAVSVITTTMIRTRSGRTGKQRTSLAVLLAGIAYIYSKKIVFGAMILDMFVVLLGGVTALLPVYAKDILHVGPTGAGLLRSAMAAGGMVSALTLTQISLTRNVGYILYISIFIFGAATLVFGVSPWFPLSLAAMAILGSADMISVYIRNTLIQIATPDEMRGRVSAVNAVFTGASNEIGEFRAGAMAALIGTMPAVIVGGLGSIIVTAACWRLFPNLLKVQRIDRAL
ncbi:MAG: MFS transporter [Desulfobacterales bacterium]|nr:MFS transporter [Desulfobacterales bacterium]